MVYRLVSKKCEEQGHNNIAEELIYLSGSHTTLRYNEFDLSEEYHDRLPDEIEDYNDDYLGPFQGRLHNYLSASYSHRKNVERVVEMIGGDLEYRYEEYINETPPLLAVRGLRNFAQHNRPLPLEVSKNVDGREIQVMVDVHELVQLDEGWDQSSLEYYFHPFVLEQGDSRKLEIMRAIEPHYHICSGLRKWLSGKIAEMNNLQMDFDWPEVKKPVYSISTS